MGIVGQRDGFRITHIGTKGGRGGDVEVEGEDVLNVLEQVDNQIRVVMEGGEELAAVLRGKGVGITEELASNHGSARSGDHKARDLEEIADGMVDVAAFLAPPSRIKLRLAGGI